MRRLICRSDRRRSLRCCGALALVALSTGCGATSDESGGGRTVSEVVTLINQAPKSDVALDDLAEAFALNSRSTDVQCERLEQALVGRAVQWPFLVYEVEAADAGRYKVTSQAIPIQEPGATPLIRVVAFVEPRNERDVQLLERVKTDDRIELRGVVREIRLRTVVVLGPAEVIGMAESITQPGGPARVEADSATPNNGEMK